MSNEYKLSFTASEIDEKLADIGNKASFTYVDDAIETIEGKIAVDKITSNLTTETLLPNTFYSFGETAELTLDFAEGNPAKVNEYMFSFISGATATALTLPSSVQWVNELTVKANKRYEISIVDNIGLWCAVDLAVSE